MLYTKNKGFTLIELVIVVAIVAIIAAIALPSYRAQVRKSNRSEAHAELLRVADLQERFYLQNNTYTTDIANVGNKPVSDNGYYNIAITAADATAFSLTATAAGDQVDDAECLTITLNSAGQKGSNPSDATVCW